MRYTVQLQVQDLRAKPVVDTRTEISILETEWIYCRPIPHPSGGECAIAEPVCGSLEGLHVLLGINFLRECKAKLDLRHFSFFIFNLNIILSTVTVANE